VLIRPFALVPDPRDWRHPADPCNERNPILIEGIVTFQDEEQKRPTYFILGFSGAGTRIKETFIALRVNFGDPDKGEVSLQLETPDRGDLGFSLGNNSVKIRGDETDLAVQAQDKIKIDIRNIWIRAISNIWLEANDMHAAAKPLILSSRDGSGEGYPTQIALQGKCVKIEAACKIAIMTENEACFTLNYGDR
jgi:hypothetical protein